MAAASRGMLIVVEGLDRAGKSTQCERLATNLRNEGCNVKCMRFPDRKTPTGDLINAYLKGDSQLGDHAIHLLFAANRWEAAAQIRQDIAMGVTLVVDRYSYSGVVYSAAKSNPELDLKWAWQSEVGLPKPDLLIFLDVSPEDAAGRGGFGAEVYENTEMQKSVRRLFHILFTEPFVGGAVVIDAGRPELEVEGSIKKVIRSSLDNGLLQEPLTRLHYSKDHSIG